MNTTQPPRDPIVTEIHAIREHLAEQYHNDLPVVHLGDNDFNVVEAIAVAEVKPLDEGQRRQLG